MQNHNFSKKTIDKLIPLLSLDKKRRELLVEELKKAKPVLTPSQLARQIYEKVGINLDDLEGYVFALFSVYSCRRQQEHKPEECAKAIIEMLENRDDKKVKIDKEFIDFLQKLLELDQSVGISEKALGLAMANDKLTVDMKIYTDLRPSFSAPIESGDIAALILHKLEITYIENNERKKIYFTMDSNDLSKIKSTVARAESKEKRLRNENGLKNIRFIEFPDN